MTKNTTKLRVRYGETDQMGVVYHANYAVYFETGRTEWLRQQGITYKQMENSGVMLPVVGLQIDYKNPAFYDDTLTLVTKLKSLPTVSIEFLYELYNNDNLLLAKGYTKLVFINMETKKIIRCPDYLMEKFVNIS